MKMFKFYKAIFKSRKVENFTDWIKLPAPKIDFKDNSVLRLK